MKSKLVFAILWLVCGFLAYGITLGYFENYSTSRYLYRSDRELRDCPKLQLERSRDHMGTAVMIAIPGPIGLGMAYAMSGFAQYGLQWKPNPSTCDESQFLYP